MADKEERIYIGIIDPKGDFCPVPYGTCNSLCDCCKGGMTRPEAIEVIAKAIFSKSGFPKDCIWEEINEETKTAFRLYAREALNALLEGGK